MKVTIEPASIRLLEELYRIEKLSFDTEAFAKREIAYLLSDTATLGLIARIGSEIVGFLIARTNMEEDKMFGHIFTLDVAPSYRRKGVAQRLLEELESLLKKRQIVECRLEVREDNVAALNLYLKLGYKRLARLENYYGGTHGLYLRKFFSSSE
jgi:ribosomal-protein-alanine N-acetyltransferase